MSFPYLRNLSGAPSWAGSGLFVIYLARFMRTKTSSEYTKYARKSQNLSGFRIFVLFRAFCDMQKSNTFPDVIIRELFCFLNLIFPIRQSVRKFCKIWSTWLNSVKTPVLRFLQAQFDRKFILKKQTGLIMSFTLSSVLEFLKLYNS